MTNRYKVTIEVAEDIEHIVLYPYGADEKEAIQHTLSEGFAQLAGKKIMVIWVELEARLDGSQPGVTAEKVGGRKCGHKNPLLNDDCVECHKENI